MQNENRDNCVRSIIHGTTRTANWRERIFEQYRDERNLWSSKALHKLSGDALNMTDHVWEKLEPHYEFGSERFRNAVSDTARHVGFKHKSKSFPFFVSNLVATLSASN